MSRPIVFVGPSGIGKGTIERYLMNKYPNHFQLTVSHTTRKPREGEIDGVHYYFTTREKMEQEIKEGKFLEYCEIHGNLYGTSLYAIDQVHKSGKVCILDVNIDGAFACLEKNLNPFIILLVPTSIEDLEKRLRGRGTDDEESLRTRMHTTQQELVRFEENKDKWNLRIVNDKLETTVEIIEKALKDIGEL